MIGLQSKWPRRIVVIVVGTTIILIGIALLVLPGPGILTILAGLAVLATELVWAKNLLDRTKSHARQAADRVPDGVRRVFPFLFRKKNGESGPSEGP